jgi:hypothetical protein
MALILRSFEYFVHRTDGVRPAQIIKQVVTGDAAMPIAPFVP